MNKYRNVAKVVDGVVFSSIKEAYRYTELRLLLKAREIRDLQIQPVFLLQAAFTDSSGRKHRPIAYIADFSYITKNGTIIVEDVKGMRTPVYLLKKKLFLYAYPAVHFVEI